MNPILETLIALHDLDDMLRDTQDPRYMKIGFKLGKHVKDLEKARQNLLKKIPANVLKRYEKLQPKYGRGIAPIVNDVCMNCFVRLPIAFASQPDRRAGLHTCPNCGIFIYWG
jgi:predicted  nucleic acid-binding Zn-ribbon protein